MIRVEVVNTFLVNIGKEFVILLRGTGDDRTLPISIGQLEAQSIALQLNKIPFPRPLTHDLLKEIIVRSNGTVLRTEICELKDETFYARLIVQINDNELAIDARPSDAIAMALRFSSPIFVDESVMNEAGVIIPEADSLRMKDTVASSEKQESRDQLSGIELLRKNLETAIEQERYEDAARIRDEINKLTKSN